MSFVPKIDGSEQRLCSLARTHRLIRAAFSVGLYDCFAIREQTPERHWFSCLSAVYVIARWQAKGRGFRLGIGLRFHEWRSQGSKVGATNWGVNFLSLLLFFSFFPFHFPSLPLISSPASVHHLPHLSSFLPQVQLWSEERLWGNYIDYYRKCIIF